MSTTEELLMKGMLHGQIAGITRKDVSRCTVCWWLSSVRCSSGVLLNLAIL